MIIITACIYFLTLALMFFIEVPELLVIVVGAGVFLSLTLYHLRGGGGGRKQGDRIWTFAKSACIAALILIALGVMQTLLVGRDTTEVLGHRVWKLYAVLAPFVIDALSTSGRKREKHAGETVKGDDDGHHHREQN